MKYLRGTLYALLAQESGQIQLLIIAPILTLSLLSLIVRTASSAIDPALEKQKVAEQLKRRLNEVQYEEELRLSQPNILPAAALPLHTSRQIKKRETFEAILKDENLNPGEAAEWIQAARKFKTLRRLHVGHTLTLFFSKVGEQRTLTSVSYEVDRKSLLWLEKNVDGHVSIRHETLPTSLVWRVAGGRIESSLYNAALQVKVPAKIVDDLADMDWDLDLSSDLRPGDTFKVVFEELQRDGKTIAPGRVLAAEIVNKGKIFLLFPITEAGEKASSRAASRKFLRYPLKFSRISSVFTSARFHPVLKRRRPHFGVDFAAPAGTPVRAVARGKVTYAGRKGGYGNFVRIDHPDPYGSSYAHLKRIAKGLRVGSPVERGQVIGYVGSTGLATGPHLHFELYKNGKYINPLTARLPIADEGAPKRKSNPRLAQQKKDLAGLLAALKVEHQPVTIVLNPPQDTQISHRTDFNSRDQKHLASVTLDPLPHHP